MEALITDEDAMDKEVADKVVGKYKSKGQSTAKSKGQSTAKLKGQSTACLVE
ncbi:hypothetical protein Tco_1409659, partial [Tanacetum coccineum]